MNKKSTTFIQFRYENKMPIGAAYVAFGLEREGIDFDMRLCPVDLPRTPREHLLKLRDLYPFFEGTGDIIAIGCFSDLLPHVLIAARRMKELDQSKIIVLGGVGPSLVAREIMGDFDFVDYVINGCGILSLPKLIRILSSGKRDLTVVPGLTYRKNGNVTSNKAYDFYSEIPKLPAYHLIPNIGNCKRFYVKTTTGCPYKCTFCYASSAAGKHVIKRDIYEVVKEIKFIQRMAKGQMPAVSVIDEAFILDADRVNEFCRLMKRHCKEVAWSSYGRIDRMTEDLLAVMSRSGCKSIYYGIESGSNHILKRIKKGFAIEKACKILQMTRKYFSNVTASFIYRYPFERIEDFKSTSDIIKELMDIGVQLQLHPLVPVKHSEIYQKYHSNLRFSIDERSDYNVGRDLDSMPKECVELIKKHPKVFYDYSHYVPADLAKINAYIEVTGHIRRLLTF